MKSEVGARAFVYTQSMTEIGWQSYLVFAVIAAAFGLFAWGRIRHDLVALLSLGALSVAGVVPADEAFSGFSNPAVISVAAILIVSQGLRSSGFVELLGSKLQGLKGGTGVQVALLSGIVCVLSGFMNNIGALAIIMPIGMQLCRKSGKPPSAVLMPMAFASLLGGMTTLIGTPPNMLLSAFRAEHAGSGYALLDFTPVGASLAILGLAFLSLVGWRLLPSRDGQKEEAEGFKAGRYLAELVVTEGSPLAGKRVVELRDEPFGLIVVSLIPRASQAMRPKGMAAVRTMAERLPGFAGRFFKSAAAKRPLPKPTGDETLAAGDTIVAEGRPERIRELVADGAAALYEDGAPPSTQQVPGAAGEGKPDKSQATAVGKADEGLAIIEAAVLPDSPLVNKSASALGLKERYGLSVLGLSRSGARITTRLEQTAIHAGDLLLLRGGPASLLDERASALGCLPLGLRSLSPRDRRKAYLAIALFGGAAAFVMAGLVAVQMAFAMAAAAMVLAGVLAPKDMYKGIDWPIIVLLGAMLPVGQALERTGGATLVSDAMLAASRGLPAWTILAILCSTTMLMSAVINNAATVVLMAPIGLGLARGLGASMDPFLMAICVGASASFLTPVAHQSNVLVMGPGGYRFGDYLRLGLPLSAIVVGAAVPLILLVWPL